MKSAGGADGTRPASAAVLVHWLNSSVGEALPEALLVDQVEDLDDGVLLCKLACLAKPGVSIQIIQDVFNEQEAIKNLSTAMRVGASLDSKIARACGGCRNPEQIALTAFGGDTRKLVIALLRVFRDHLHQPKRRRSSMGQGSKSKITARSVAQSKTGARQKTHDSSRKFARSRPSSLPMRSPDMSAKILRERPQWNGSVALSPSASAKDAKLQPKVHNDPSTEVSSVRLVANGELVSTRSKSSKTSACAADGLSPVNAGLVLSALRRLRQSTSGVTASYLASFDWLLHADHLPRILRRLEQVGVPIYAPASSPPTVSAIDYVAAVLSDGILLSELARMSEPRLGVTAAGGRRKQPVIEKLFVRPDGATEKLLFYRGVSLDPRTTAARMKNVTVALESFRDRARMNHRHLYAADGIVKKQPPAIVWELIEDLRQSLPLVVARHSPAKQNVNPRNTAKASVSVPDQNLQQSRPRSASLDVGSVDIAADHDRRVRTFAFQTSGQANGDASSCAEPQGSLRKQRLSHTSQTMRQLPAWSPPPPPQLQMPSSPVHAAPPGTLGSEEIAALASWLRDLGLHVPDDTHDCPLLEDVRFNGKLLLTLFSTLSEDAKAAYSQSGSLRRLQGAKVTSVQQAVALVREALGEMRTAVAKTQPRPTSSRAALMQALKADPTEIARGREQAFWQLINAVHKAFSKIKCSADVERRRAKVALLETRDHGEEDVHIETRTERLDRTYKQTRDIVPSITTTKNDPPNSKVSLRDESRLAEGSLLPYTLAQLGQLEASLLGWLRRRGILEEICGSDGSFNSILGPPLLRRAWVDGSLLLRIIAKICSDKPLRGLVLPAHTPQVEKANLEKVLEYLRRHSSMGRRFLFSKDALWECDRMVVLGLLEDLHRLDAGLLPRPSRVVPGESPFLGTKPPRSRREQLSKQGPEQELTNVAPELTATPTTLESRGRRHPDADIWPSPFSSDDVLLYSRRRLGSSTSCVSIAPEEDCASPWKPQVATPRSDIVPRPRTSSDFKRKSEHDAKPCAPWASKVIPQEPTHAFSELSTRQIDSLIDWVKRTSPKPVRGLDQLHQGEARILALSDGTVLAGMVEKLERIRGGLGGIQHKPKTVAAMLGNLRLALGRLQKNKRMKPDLLWSERELAAGNTRTWLALLADMHRAYV